MFETFKNQIQKILSDTEKKESNITIEQKTMLKLMVYAIQNFVEQEAKNNESFSEALSYEWKSAERLLKFVWDKAKSLASTPVGASGMCAFVPDDVVYDWVCEYYARDDKAEVEKEIADAKKKKEENERRKYEEMRKNSDLRRDAYIEIREGECSDDYTYLTVKRIEEVIQEMVRNKKYNLSSKPAKSSTKTKSKSKKEETTDVVSDTNVDEAEVVPVQSNARIVENAVCNIDASPDGDGQFTLADLVTA